MYEIEDDDNATSYEDSSGEEYSVEELSESEVVSKTSYYPRYNKKDASPKFEIGMKFNGKKRFKKAVTKHGLVERRFIRFIKNEADRIIAKCDWATCQWRCMALVRSRSSSWQIASLNDVHTCPPRRDNRLVTAARIAEKYEKMIIANPTWSIEAMKTTIQEEMFADVNDSKLKRAKSIVIQRALDATKGQYKLLYNYQLELLRSNPGSTVVVRKDLDYEDHVFQRMYICLGALKKGFLAGCRKVVGLDGCFSREQQMESCCVQLGGMPITRCILWLGQLLRKRQIIVGTGFVIYSLETLVLVKEMIEYSYLTNKRAF
jgi:alpha-galactosidase